MATTTDELRDEVRRRYAESARAVTDGSAGCGWGRARAVTTPPRAQSGAPSSARSSTTPSSEASSPIPPCWRHLGAAIPSRSPTCTRARRCSTSARAVASTCILSAKRVGPTGIAYGLDMTDEMLALARRNAAEAGITNVHFLKGVIEQIPLPADSVDVVISNCVINLSVDKAAVLTEIARVLRPGGRVGVSDVVAEDHLSRGRPGRARRVRRLHRRGALQGRVHAGLEAAGFEDVSVEFTHEVAEGMHGAIVKAVKASDPRSSGPAGGSAGRPGGLLLGSYFRNRFQRRSLFDSMSAAFRAGSCRSVSMRVV